MNTSTDRPVAVVTGGAGGLGSAVARELADAGFFVFINFLSSEDRAHSLAKELEGMAEAVRADVSSPPQVRAMAEVISSRAGRLDVLVNNAGIAVDGLLVRYPEIEWERVIDINLKGCFNCIQALVPLMIESGGGHVVNISSRSGIAGRAGQAAYSAAKAGLIGFGKTLARELAKDGILVNTVVPGYMATEMGRAAERALGMARDESLLGSLTGEAEVARFIAGLCRLSGVTGQVFVVDSRLV